MCFANAVELVFEPLIRTGKDTYNSATKGNNRRKSTVYAVVSALGNQADVGQGRYLRILALADRYNTCITALCILEHIQCSRGMNGKTDTNQQIAVLYLCNRRQRIYTELIDTADIGQHITQIGRQIHRSCRGGTLTVTIEGSGTEISSLYLEGPTEIVKVYEI